MIFASSHAFSLPLSSVEFKEVLGLKQEYMVTKPFVATAITLTEQVFMLECGLSLNRLKLENLIQSDGFEQVAQTISRTQGVIGIYDAKRLLKEELRQHHCNKG